MSSTSATSISNNSIPCWATLEPALNQLFPSASDFEFGSSLASEDFLKLYTLVFEHCVGPLEGKKSGGTAIASLASGEDLYFTLVKYLESRFNNWSIFINNCDDILNNLLAQLDKLQAAEKPLTFIFTYLERHWIDRQINESRVDVLPMKQLIWSMWDEKVLKGIWPHRVLPEVLVKLRAVRCHQIELEELESVAKFVHYLRVIAKPTQLESDYKATRKVMMAGAVINPRAIHQDRFKEFTQWYCSIIDLDAPNSREIANISDFIQISLQFWNEEEGRMSFLRFDKSAQISVRNHLKSLLLLPNLEIIKLNFRTAIINLNVLEANSIYRLLSNRKSLLVQLDQESEIGFIEKGQEILQNISTMPADEIERSFINLLGQYYNLTTEMIQTSFASRPEIFESRSKAFRTLLNQQGSAIKRKGFAARCLAKFADYVIRNYPDSSDDNLKVLLALFRLIDDKEEFHETFGKLLGIRLLTGITRLPSRFEADLLKELKEICGSFYVKSFERMFADVNEKELPNVTVITSGNNWNLRGKLLPGHVLFENSSWPSAIEAEISGKIQKYHQKYPKRKLFWSSLLSSIEFQYTLQSGVSVMLKATMLHFNVLKMISETVSLDSDALTKKFGTSTNLVLNSLLRSGLITKNMEINQEFSTNVPVIDLYEMTLNDLVHGTSSTTPQNSNVLTGSTGRSNTSTPLYFHNNSNGNNNSNSVQSISPIDKSILLQCSITRILKQLRSLCLPDLFSRISMLPKILTRFSPTLTDLMDALKQLHEKEFVQLVFGDGIDEMIELTEEDLKNINNYQYNDNLFIKYLA